MNEFSPIEVMAPKQITPAPGADLDTLVSIYCGKVVAPSNDPCGHGYTVPDEAVNAFIKDVVSVCFPEGFTITEALGGWRDVATGKTILEPSMVIQAAVSGRSKDSDIRFAANVWKKEFFQDAVMVTRQALAAVDFV